MHLRHSGSADAPTVLQHARVARHVTVLEADDSGPLGHYVRLDAAGRWTAFGGRDEHSCRRTLTGDVIRPYVPRVQVLPPARARDVHEAAWNMVRGVHDALERGGRIEHLIGSREVLLERLEAALAWTPDRMRDHHTELRAAWLEAPPILPPHRYRDLVVLPATGCPNHRCTFCAFYRDRAFRVLQDDAFDAHLEAVANVLGPALDERNGVFLGSASALSLGDDLLLARLDRIEARFGRPDRGIAAFLDPDRSPERTVADWRRLAAAGLREATLGLETALPDLREEMGKSGDVAHIRATVDALHAAGIRVGLTVLLGLRTGQEEAAHREATIACLEDLQLNQGDHVYLSPLSDEGLTHGTQQDLARWREALKPRTTAKVAPYLIERFAWLT
ncbi:MAG: radical SAM protein [Planctomycetota bacterium]|nr:radical SAM protein [Planctomycetota bacterium]